MLPLAQRHGVHILPAGEYSLDRALFIKGVGWYGIELTPCRSRLHTLLRMQHGPHACCMQHGLHACCMQHDPQAHATALKPVLWTACPLRAVTAPPFLQIEHSAILQCIQGLLEDGRGPCCILKMSC